MSEFAARTRRSPAVQGDRYASARPAARVRSSSPPDIVPAGMLPQSLPGQLNQTQVVQKLARLQRSLNQSPRVAELARISTPLQQRPPRPANLAHRVGGGPGRQHTRRPGAATGSVLQRALGLEFETGWQVYHELPSKHAGAPPLEIPYRKEEKIFGARADPPGWSMETDGKDIEFVVEPPFEESALGMTALNRVMGTLDQFITNLNVHRGAARLTPATHPQFFQTQDRNAVIRPNGDQLKAQPQATVGVRLDRVDDLFMEMGRGGNTGDLASRQGTDFYANRAIAAAAGGRHAPNVNGAPASDALKGFLTLIIQYIKQGDAPGRRAYAKDIAYAMARTDFAAMFNLLPEAAFFGGQPQAWVDYVLTAAGFPNTDNDQLIKQQIADGQDMPTMTAGQLNALPTLPLTRGQWLRSMSQGADLLTQARTINQPAYTDVKGGNRLRAMGLLGNTTDAVGGNHLAGVILELRQMKREIPATEWLRVARGLLTYLIALNASTGSKANAGQTQYGRV